MNTKIEAKIQTIQSGNLVFHLSPQRLGVEIGFQFFVIKAADQYRVAYVPKMRRLIEDGVILSVNDFYEKAARKVILVYSTKRAFYDACERLDGVTINKTVEEHQYERA